MTAGEGCVLIYSPDPQLVLSKPSKLEAQAQSKQCKRWTLILFVLRLYPGCPEKGGDDGLLIRDKLFWFAVFSSLQQTTVDLIFPIFTSLPQKLDFSQATAITATTRWKFLSLLYLVLFLVSVFFFKIIHFFFFLIGKIQRQGSVSVSFGSISY